MSKVIAIDFGLKRTGIAISDDAKMFAFGHDTVNSDLLMQELKTLIPLHKVETVVLGLPLNLDNSATDITPNVYLFKEALEVEFPDLKVELLDERLTSKMASQAMHISGATKKQKREKGLVDKVSATIILQSYLEMIRNV